MKLSSETTDRVHRAAEKFSDYLRGIVNEPSVGLFRVREHIGRSIPALVDRKTELRNELEDIDRVSYDVDYCRLTVRNIAEVSPVFDSILAFAKSSASGAAGIKQTESGERLPPTLPPRPARASATVSSGDLQSLSAPQPQPLPLPQVQPVQSLDERPHAAATVDTSMLSALAAVSGVADVPVLSAAVADTEAVAADEHDGERGTRSRSHSAVKDDTVAAAHVPEAATAVSGARRPSVVAAAGAVEPPVSPARDGAAGDDDEAALAAGLATTLSMVEAPTKKKGSRKSKVMQFKQFS